MMASSTNSPMAIAKPPSVIVFTDNPNIEKIIAVITIESGIAVSEIIVVRTLKRKRKRMMITRMEPSRNASITLVMELSMKCDC